MTISLRQAAVFASGLLLGAAAAAWFVMGSHPAASPGVKQLADAPPPQAAAVALRPPAEAAAQTRPLAPGFAVMSHRRAECPSETITAIAGNGDGRLKLQSSVSARTASDFSALVLVGKEAAAAGHPRDAEVAFLMACRVADKVKGPDSIESADAKYQLGRHYANVALAGGAAAGANRAALLRRAELLYADSLEAYHVKYGDKHEKSRFAAAGLSAVRQLSSPNSGGGQVASVPVPRPPVQVALPKPIAPATPVQGTAAAVVEAPGVAVAVPRPIEPAGPMRAAATPRPEFPERAEPVTRPATGSATSYAGVRPSFDCTRARSRSERIICSDAELSQLDHELGRLHARAKNAAPDAAAFKRQNADEWRRRESTCHDHECLLRWYAQRRDQLMNELQ